MVPQLERLGDTEEQQNWPYLKDLVPHYETFWQQYVFPLRADGEIWLRRGLEPLLEHLAIASYSAFTALARGRIKIFDEPEDYRHVEELYMHLQRAGEIGVKLIKAFQDIERSVLGRVGAVAVSPLEVLIEARLKPYRNLIHDAKRAMPKGEGGRMLPKPEKLQEYVRWSDAMFSFREQDFVSAESQVKSDFYATAAALEGTWKAMSGAFNLLSNSHEFRRMLHQGEPAHTASAAMSVSASGSFVIGGGCQLCDNTTEFVIKPLRETK